MADEDIRMGARRYEAGLMARDGKLAGSWKPCNQVEVITYKSLTNGLQAASTIDLDQKRYCVEGGYGK